MARARAAGLRAVLTCGEDVASSEVALRLSRRHREVRVAVGIHPHRSASCDAASLTRLRELATQESVMAIGEIGLDFSGRSAPRDVQERAFDAQVRLAAEIGLPVVVHVRDSGTEVRRRLAALPAVRGQVHCYSEGVNEIPGWLERGFALSFAGTLTYRNASSLREAVRAVPEDRILFETDAPYLAPEPHRGRVNEPAFVRETIAFAARERDADAEALASRAWRNGLELFGPRLAGGA
jgi:TatD DNase family protein